MGALEEDLLIIAALCFSRGCACPDDIFEKLLLQDQVCGQVCSVVGGAFSDHTTPENLCSSSLEFSDRIVSYSNFFDRLDDTVWGNRCQFSTLRRILRRID